MDSYDVFLKVFVEFKVAVFRDDPYEYLEVFFAPVALDAFGFQHSG
jgi:hypothetical protein